MTSDNTIRTGRQRRHTTTEGSWTRQAFQQIYSYSDAAASTQVHRFDARTSLRVVDGVVVPEPLGAGD